MRKQIHLLVTVGVEVDAEFSEKTLGDAVSTGVDNLFRENIIKADLSVSKVLDSSGERVYDADTSYRGVTIQTIEDDPYLDEKGDWNP